MASIGSVPKEVTTIGAGTTRPGAMSADLTPVIKTILEKRLMGIIPRIKRQMLGRKVRDQRPGQVRANIFTIFTIVHTRLKFLRVALCRYGRDVAGSRIIKLPPDAFDNVLQISPYPIGVGVKCSGFRGRDAGTASGSRHAPYGVDRIINEAIITKVGGINPVDNDLQKGRQFATPGMESSFPGAAGKAVGARCRWTIRLNKFSNDFIPFPEIGF